MFVYAEGFTIAVLVQQLEAISSHKAERAACAYLPWRPTYLVNSAIKESVQERNSSTSIHWESYDSVREKQM